jgi:hypothetical protein
VRLSAGPRILTFEVADAGAGFDPATTERGMGLQIMQDRVDALEGELLGFAVDSLAPLGRKAEPLAQPLTSPAVRSAAGCIGSCHPGWRSSSLQR